MMCNPPDKADFNNTALLLIDLQKESNFGIAGVDQVIQNAGQLIEKCREKHIPIFYTRQVNRTDGVGLSLNEPRTPEGKPYFYPDDSENIEIFPEIYPNAEDIVVDKYRWSGFFGTHLELLLRSMNIEHLLIGGFVTDGCVMTSVFDAYFRDFNISLVKDLCAATNDGAHKAAILLMCNWIYGITIYETEELIKSLDGKHASTWTAAWPDEMQFSPENLHQIYEQLSPHSRNKKQ